LWNAIISDPEGFVPLSTLLTFNRLKSLTTDESVVAEALRLSKELLEVHQDGTRVRRKTQIQPRPQQVLRTIYVEGIPKSNNAMDEVQKRFAQFGNVEYVKILNSTNDDGAKEMNGNAWIEFTEVDAAKNATEADVKLGDVELKITLKRDRLDQLKTAEPKEDKERWGHDGYVRQQRDFQLHYLPKTEQPERRRDNRAREGKKEVGKIADALVYITSLDPKTSREDIRDFFNEHGVVEWIAFKREEPDAYILFREGIASSLVKKLSGEPVKLLDSTIEMRVAGGLYPQKRLTL
jgi:lupus La protein